MPTRRKEWFLVVSTFTRLHDTKTVGGSLMFLNQVCSIRSKVLSCLYVFRDGSEQSFRGTLFLCLYIYVSL